MAQWDVYPNPSPRTREEVPFLVDLQSDLLSAFATRLVAPLVRTQVAARSLPRRLSPGFSVAGGEFFLLPHEAGPIDARLLKRRVMSLKAHSHEIADALDAVLSGI